MPTDDELAEQGTAVFRGIVGRSRVGLCAKRIARDRYCPARTTTERGLFCERHRRREDQMPRLSESDLAAIENDVELEAAGLTLYWSEVATSLVAEVRAAWAERDELHTALAPEPDGEVGR